MSNFAEKLKQARAKTGLSQQRVADLMLIPKRTVQKWEIEAATPPEYVQRFVLNELEDIANWGRDEARANYKKKVKTVRVELYGTDEDIKEHLDRVNDAGWSIQGYIKGLIRADKARVSGTNPMLRRMLAELESGRFTDVICSENGKAAIEHTPIVDRETWEAAQAIIKAKIDRPAAPVGYKWQDDELVVDKSETDLVNRLFDKVVENGPDALTQEDVNEVRAAIYMRSK